MKKLILFFIILISNIMNGQHCGYDFSSIIVVKIHTREILNTIPNLKVILVNKNIKDLELTLTQTTNFPFLTDEYSIVVGCFFEIENWFLKIESVQNSDNNLATNYYPAEIKLSENDKFRLCGSEHSDNYYRWNEARVYKPIEVILNRNPYH